MPVASGRLRTSPSVVRPGNVSAVGWPTGGGVVGTGTGAGADEDGGAGVGDGGVGVTRGAAGGVTAGAGLSVPRQPESAASSRLAAACAGSATRVEGSVTPTSSASGALTGGARNTAGAGGNGAGWVTGGAARTFGTGAGRIDPAPAAGRWREVVVAEPAQVGHLHRHTNVGAFTIRPAPMYRATRCTRLGAPYKTRSPGSSVELSGTCGPRSYWVCAVRGRSMPAAA